MNLKKLKETMPYKWRVQSFSKFKPQATCVAYVDARQVQDKLDEVCGQGGWQCKYSEHKGNLFCSIGIKIGEEWVWKSDCGTESNVDKEKGEASDSFKRAAVKWGCFRFLYDLKMVYVGASEKKTKQSCPYVVNENWQRVWDLTKYINDKNKPTTPKYHDPRQMIDHFATLGVDELMLETRYDLSKIDDEHREDSLEVAKAIRNGDHINKYFNAEALR